MKMKSEYPGSADIALMVMCWMRNKGMTVANGAKKLGMSYPTLHRRLSDPSTMTIGELKKISKVTGKSPDELLKIMLGV